MMCVIAAFAYVKDPNTSSLLTFVFFLTKMAYIREGISSNTRAQSYMDEARRRFAR